MARKYALLENNIVIEIRSIEDSEVSEVAKLNMLIDIEDQLPEPTIGWMLQGNKLVAMENQTQEQFEIELAGKKRVAGKAISDKCIDMIGARNKMLSKTTQQIVAVLTALSPIRALLETGALGTARTSIGQASAGYPDYADIFQEAINEINDFEAKYSL